MYKLMIICVLVTSCARGEDFYSHTVEDHNGQNVFLEKFRGKVTLVVNVASKCGFTESTYRDLQRLQDILGYDGHFSVLAFPCNQFGEQEPWEMPQILEYLNTEFHVEFPIFNKISILGDAPNAAFKYLVDESSTTPDWNFYKYLVDGSGHVVASYDTKTPVEELFDNVKAEIDKVKLVKKDKGKKVTKEEL